MKKIKQKKLCPIKRCVFFFIIEFNAKQTKPNRINEKQQKKRREKLIDIRVPQGLDI